MEAVMMGKRVMAEPVFSTVRINDYLPAGHLLRAVDALLDTAFVRVTVHTPLPSGCQLRGDAGQR